MTKKTMTDHPDRNAFLGEIVRDLAPRDLLEIGCGGGRFAKIITGSLPSVRYTGIDRSQLAIARCEQRNGRGIQEGRIRFLHGDFRSLPNERPYDVCCAVNVNAFWTDPKVSFERARALLEDRGSLALAFEAPSTERSQMISDRLRTVEHNPFGLARQVWADSRLFAMIFLAAAHPSSRGHSSTV